MRFRSQADRRKLFSELLAEYGDQAFSFAARLTGDDLEARELVQEAFVRAYDSLEEYDPARPFYTWIGSLLHNIYVDGVRRAGRRPTVPLEGDDPEGPSVAAVLREPGPAVLDTLLDAETDRSVQDALDRLEPEMRTAVALCDIEGFSYEQASAVMGSPVGTVRSRLARGRARLRELLTPYVKAGEESHVS